MKLKSTAFKRETPVRQSTRNINTQKQNSARGPWSTTAAMHQLQTSTTIVGGRVKTHWTRSKPRYNPLVQTKRSRTEIHCVQTHNPYRPNRNQKEKQILRIKNTSQLISYRATSEAHAVNNLRPRFIILVLGDPHLLEGGERGQDGSSNPHRVLSFRRSHHLDLNTGRCQSSHLFVQSLVQVREHSTSPREHRVPVQVTTDIHIALHDARVCQLVDTLRLAAQHVWLEQDLSAAEAFITHSNNLSIGQLVVHLEVRGGISFCHFRLEIDRHIAHPLLDVTHNFPIPALSVQSHSGG